MKYLRINFILPFPVTKPLGGAKIMYEYANRLRQRGHTVTIFHSIKRPFKHSNTPLWYKRLVFWARGVARPKWFNLNRDIRSVIIPEVTNKYIPDADVCLSTWWQMTYALNKLSPSKGKKFNLIQGYETWAGHKEQVDASFSLPVHHIVIATYLQQLVSERSRGTKPLYIPNAIDNKYFFLQNNPAERNPFSIIMLYSKEIHKDSDTGMKALQLLRQKYPALTVQLFGVHAAPTSLPGGFTYVQQPGNLGELYNKSAIFLSTSLTEGFGLPAAEAMACGCAVVCTAVGGHLDFAINGKTALTVSPGKIDDVIEKTGMLLTDNNLRLQMAYAGNELITKTFNWEESLKKLEAAFYDSI